MLSRMSNIFKTLLKGKRLKRAYVDQISANISQDRTQRRRDYQVRKKQIRLEEKCCRASQDDEDDN